MYEIILYDTEDGRCPVQELLDSLEPEYGEKTCTWIRDAIKAGICSDANKKLNVKSMRK